MENEKSNILKEFNEVCFSLNNLEAKLTNIMIENFILNPEIKNLTQQIKDLRNKKEELKVLLKEVDDGE